MTMKWDEMWKGIKTGRENKIRQTALFLQIFTSGNEQVRFLIRTCWFQALWCLHSRQSSLSYRPGIKSTTLSVHGGKPSSLTVIELHIEIHPHSQIRFCSSHWGKLDCHSFIECLLGPYIYVSGVIPKRHSSVLFFYFIACREKDRN